MQHSQEMQAFLAQRRFASFLRARRGPQVRTRSQLHLVGGTSSGAGRRLGGPSEPAHPTSRGAPPRTRVGAGWWRRPAAGTPRPSPWAAAAAFATRRAQLGRREPALPAPPTPRSPRRAPRTRAWRGPGCGPELLEPDP